MNEEQANELRGRQAALSALVRNPNWAVFVAEADRKEAKLRKQLEAHTLGPRPVDQRKVDWIRGYIAALDWLTKTPEVAEAALVQFMESLQEREAEEDGG